MNKRFENFTFGIIKLYKLVQKIKLIEMREYGLKAIHVMCLYSLAVYGKITASELIKHTLEDKAAISRALKLLAEQGYVTYDADSYNSPIGLTEKGEKVAEAIDEKAQRAVDAAGGTLTQQQRETFYQCLGTISDKLEEYYKSMAVNVNE
ncbi:MAG: MarR family winged helix-turn-helix transcriptional regulator [Clostridia bacterium]|nr:MarR family winged helix-turn-helix transcriptional regulator [Clostridia bacterium]